MKKTNVTFLLYILLLFSCTKNKNDIKLNSPSSNDSLDSFFKLANDDSISNDKRKVYIERIVKVISIQRNDSLNRVNYFKVANRYFNINDLENYKVITELIIKNSEKSNDSISLGKAYGYMSDYYIKKSNPDSTYLYNYKSEKLYKNLKDNSNIAKALLNKAILQHNENDFLSCEKTVFEALKYLRYSNNDEMIYESYNLLGIIYGELAEYKLSREYYNKAILMTDKNGMSPEYHLKAITLNNIGLLYRKQNKDYEAIQHFTLALQQKNIHNDRPNVYAILVDNLGYSKFKTKNYIDLPELFYEALRIKDSIHIVPEMILNRIHLSEYYSFKKDTAQAIKFAREAYDLANTNNEKRDVLATLKQLSNVEPKRALEYSAQYYKIDDSLQLAERKIRNKFARIEFETEELSIEKEKLVEQRKTLIYVGLAIILIGLFIYVIRLQAAKNRELTLVQEQQKANEEIYQLMLSQENKVEEVRQAEKQKIAQELHDGVLGKLFGTRMNLGILNTKNDEKGISDRSIYIDELKNLEQEIREISHDLNSAKTAVYNNFALMVNSFIETQQSVCTAAITFSIDPKIKWNLVDNTSKINLYRILQEAFQNINKHAEAKNVSVTLHQSENLIHLQIQDDGIGFNYNRKKNGIGLQNMRSRINGSAGSMTVETKIGVGTTLQFELPLHN